MEIIPAIDLSLGRCVRLTQGNLAEKTEYFVPPWQAAVEWQQEGARWLHIVDLDGAFDGSPRNLKAFEAIRSKVSCRLQVGGGIRSLDSASRWIESGADRLVLSTLLSENFSQAAKIAQRFPGRILASVDLRQGRMQVCGWTESRPMFSLKGLKEPGFAGIIFTDTARDGMLQGQTGSFLEGFDLPLPFFVAGGITSVADVIALRNRGAAGVIIGKALYEGNLRLADALEAVSC